MCEQGKLPGEAGEHKWDERGRDHLAGARQHDADRPIADDQDAQEHHDEERQVRVHGPAPHGPSLRTLARTPVPHDAWVRGERDGEGGGDAGPGGGAVRERVRVNGG